MLEGMEGMDWYWLMLMRCSSIFGFVVVLVLMALGRTSKPLWLLSNKSSTIRLGLELPVLLWSLQNEPRLIWTLDAASIFQGSWCLRSHSIRWSFLHCAARQYYKNQVRQAKWPEMWFPWPWAPCYRREQRPSVSCSTFGHRSCKSRGRLLGCSWRFGWVFRLGRQTPLNLL